MQKLLRTLGVAPNNGSLFLRVYFTFFASGLMSVLLGTLLPYIRAENALSYSESGLLLSGHQVGNLASVLLAGVLPYAIGQRKSALFLGAGTAIGLALMGLTHGMWPLFLAFAFTGIGRGSMSNLCNAVVSRTAGKKTAALNLLHGVFALGALLSPLLVFIATLRDESGWKYAAFFTAALTAITWVLLWRGGISDAKVEKKGGSSFAFLRDGQLWGGTMLLFFYLCAEASIVGWFVVYFRETGILPELAARFVPSMLWLMMLTGRILCAVLASRVGKMRLLLILSIGVTICFAGLLLSKTALPCTAFLLGLGLTMGGIYPTAFATVKGTDSAAATGFVLMMAGFGAILMPGVVGAVADRHGLTGGVATVLAALACMTALTIYRLVREKHQPAKLEGSL
jgi:fucose permease